MDPFTERLGHVALHLRSANGGDAEARNVAPVGGAGAQGVHHGGRLLVQSLLAHGVDRVFAVPGESYLAVLDGLYDAPSVEVVICRQEGGCAIMAEADGKLKGTPGVAMVTRGPGATNASAGVHIALQDSTPMILLVGQVGRSMLDREAFQEVDYRKMYGLGVGLAKAAFQIDSPEGSPEYMNRAFSLACSGRPGPVVLALPEDVLSAELSNDIPPPLPSIVPRPSPPSDAIAELGTRIAASQRPIVLAGGGGWCDATNYALGAFASKFSMPVALAFRRQDNLSNLHPCYVGHVGIGPDPCAPSLQSCHHNLKRQTK